MAPAMHSRRNRLLARGTSAVLLAIGALALVHSLGWRGARFPGFFVMPNRVVPSAALPGWSGVADGRPLYQNILLAVDDVPIAAAEDGYRRAAAHAAGEPAAYLFARAGGVETRTFAARYEFFAYEPGAYSAMHNLSQALAGIPVLVLVARLALATDQPPPELGQAGLRRMLAGTLVGLVIPAIVLAVSGATGGRIPVNASAWVGFLFPLACLSALRQAPASPPRAA